MDSLLALIPARGGSKGLPNKNILPCAGRPLITWTITAAKESGVMADVVVSTDSTEIAEVAQKAGATVPFLRPSDLATDEASMLDVIQHAWENALNAQGKRYDQIVLLQPTSPLRNAVHIRTAVDHYFSSRKTNDDTLASVYPVSRKFGWLMHVPADDGYVRFCLNKENNNPQRQQLRNLYMPNGAIFILRGGAVMRGIYHDNTIPFLMRELDSIDIDSREDFDDAERQLLARLVS